MTRRALLATAPLLLLPREPELRLEGVVLYVFLECPELILRVERVVSRDGPVTLLTPPRAKRIRIDDAWELQEGQWVAVTGADLGRGKPLAATRFERKSPPLSPDDETELPVEGAASAAPSVRLDDGTRLEGRRLLTVTATAYGPGENGAWGDRTKLETSVGRGTVAVDPRVIPLRSRLWVEGYGFCVALDTGGAIKGLRIDLGCDSDEEAALFGRQRRRVLVLGT